MKQQERIPDVLVLKNVSVKRGAFRLHVPDMRLRPGTINCVVGLNGSGKTSLLLTALGLLPHEGQCLVDGIPYDGTAPKVKCRVGFIPDDPDLLFEELTAREQWEAVASVFSKVRRTYSQESLMIYANEIARRLSFVPPPYPAREYSHGMRKKTQIVTAIMGMPRLLVIDELRNGLDPLAIAQAEQLVRHVSNEGSAILVATHDLWWAERFADVIYVMHKGGIVAYGPPAQLLQAKEKHLEQAFSRIIRRAK